MNCRNLVTGSCVLLAVAAMLYAQDPFFKDSANGNYSTAVRCAEAKARRGAPVRVMAVTDPAIPPPPGMPLPGTEGPFVNHSVEIEVLDPSIGEMFRTASTKEQQEFQKYVRCDLQLVNETRKLTAALADASGTERTELEKELEQVVTQHFELKQEMRELELAQLEARVLRLRDLHDRRNEAKDAIIAKRLEQLSDEAKGLGWTVSPSPKIGQPVPNSEDVLIWHGRD